MMHIPEEQFLKLIYKLSRKHKQSLLSSIHFEPISENKTILLLIATAWENKWHYNCNETRSHCQAPRELTIKSKPLLILINLPLSSSIFSLVTLYYISTGKI